MLSSSMRALLVLCKRRDMEYFSSSSSGIGGSRVGSKVGSSVSSNSGEVQIRRKTSIVADIIKDVGVVREGWIGKYCIQYSWKVRILQFN